MRCRSCGVDLPDDAAFCSQCGARVELGSVLGVGTDLPPVPPRDRPQSPPSATSATSEPEGEIHSAHSPTQGQPDDLGQTRELPRLDPGATPAAPRAAATVPAAATAAPRAAAATTSMTEQDREPTHSRNSILAMVATFAVLTIIGTFALTRLVGSDDPQPTTQSSASSSVTAEESGDAPADASPAPPSASPTTSPSSSASPTQEVSPSASASMPPQARRCSTSGRDAVATAYAGTERTSCEFAAAVREAYREAGTPGGATSLRAYSPVTKKWYSLSCDGGEPVRCTSTTNAIVLLAP